MRDLVQVSLPSLNGSIKATFVDVEYETVDDLVARLLKEDGAEVAQELGCDFTEHTLRETGTPSPSPLNVNDDDKKSAQKWGIQRIVISQPSREWKDDELLELAKGCGESLMRLLGN